MSNNCSIYNMRGSKNDTTIIKCNLSSANGKNKIDRYHLLFNNYSLQSTQKLLIKGKILFFLAIRILLLGYVSYRFLWQDPLRCWVAQSTFLLYYTHCSSYYQSREHWYIYLWWCVMNASMKTFICLLHTHLIDHKAWEKKSRLMHIRPM